MISEKKNAPQRARGLSEYIASGPTGVLTREKHVARAMGAIGLGYCSARSYLVGREKIRDYAGSIFATHPAHYNEQYIEANGQHELIASPTFVGILGIIAQRPLTEGFVVGYDISQIMQTEQKIEYFHPIFAGDELWVDVIFESFREIAGADIIVTRNEVYNQHEINVLSSWTTLVARVVDEVNTDAENALKGVVFSEREIR